MQLTAGMCAALLSESPGRQKLLCSPQRIRLSADSSFVSGLMTLISCTFPFLSPRIPYRRKFCVQEVLMHSCNLFYKRDSGPVRMTAISHKCGFTYELLGKFYDLRNKYL